VDPPDRTWKDEWPVRVDRFPQKVLASTMTYDEYRGTTRFPALDGLRGIAAGMVIFFHYGGAEWTWLSGWIGVHIFFALSGFLITTLALREEEVRGRVSLRNFYVRRSFRIVPVYVVVLAVLAAIVLLRGEWEASGLGPLLPYYLTFNGEFLGPGQPHGHVWTLGIEQKFYLLWPLLAFAAVLGAARRSAIAVTLLLLLLVLCPAQPMLISYVPIVGGCLLAVVLHSRRGFEALAFLTRPRVATVVGIAFVAIHLAVTSVDAWLGNDGRVVLLYSLPVVVLLATLVGGGMPGRLLSHPALTFVGDRSYSLYLVQGVAGVVAASVVPRFGAASTTAAVAVLVIGLLLADLLYRWVELPFIALGRRFTSTRQRPVAAPGGGLGPSSRDQPRPPVGGGALVDSARSTRRTPRAPQPPTDGDRA
jgi:peptidoglycan/LPS O-acetylase OafA/YrhL